ncbi:hypothetical protein RI054_30g120560 [Pseudoscourfieldia marina]
MNRTRTRLQAAPPASSLCKLTMLLLCTMMCLSGLSSNFFVPSSSFSTMPTGAAAARVLVPHTSLSSSEEEEGKEIEAISFSSSSSGGGGGGGGRRRRRHLLAAGGWSQASHEQRMAKKVHEEHLRKHASNPHKQGWVKHHTRKTPADRARHALHESGVPQKHKRKGGAGGYFAHASKTPAQRAAWQKRARKGGHPHANDKVW